MNKKERIEAVIRHKKIDKIPWTMYASYPPWGETERRFRNEELTLIYQHFPICKLTMPEVKITEESHYLLGSDSGRNVIIRKFSTPRGEASTKHELFINSLPTPGDLIQKFGSEIDQEMLSWVTGFPFQSESDYEILEFIYENMQFSPNFEEFIKTEELIGSDGFIMANLGQSPFQTLLYQLMGIERCYLEYDSNPKKFRRLYQVLYENLRRKYRLAAESPAHLFWSAENLTSMLTPPDLFQEFYIPFYNEMAEILHKKGKVYAVHMDGNLQNLVHLIKETKIDIIEAFTPPPMGDLSVADAMKIWKDKIIWINFPGTLLATADAKEIKEYTIGMLKSVAPGDNFMIGCTESFPMERWEMAFGAISNTLKEYGNYPIQY